jgi:hypothetical protein
VLDAQARPIRHIAAAARQNTGLRPNRSASQPQAIAPKNWPM